MNNTERFIFDAESMTDMEMAAVMGKLIGICSVDVVFTLEGRRRFRGPQPELTCRLAKRILRRLTEDNGHDVVTDKGEIEKAYNHLNTCEKCAEWDRADRPFEFDPTWDFHRRLLCNRAQDVLRNEEKFPFTYRAATAHAMDCRSCFEWLTYVVAVRTCHGTREAIDSWKWEWEDIIVETQPRGLLFAHIEKCEECKKWCHDRVDCGHVRQRLQSIHQSNIEEYKPQRRIVPGPYLHFHLSSCPECISWVRENIEPGGPAIPIYAAFQDVEELILKEVEMYREISRIFEEATRKAVERRVEKHESQISPDPRGRETPIDELPMSDGKRFRLKKVGLQTLGDIADKTEEELLALKRMTPDLMDDIRRILKANKL